MKLIIKHASSMIDGETWRAAWRGDRITRAGAERWLLQNSAAITTSPRYSTKVWPIENGAPVWPTRTDGTTSSWVIVDLDDEWHQTTLDQRIVRAHDVAIQTIEAVGASLPALRDAGVKVDDRTYTMVEVREARRRVFALLDRESAKGPPSQPDCLDDHELVYFDDVEGA